MAKLITEILIDDLDGTEISSESGGTVAFSFQGINYEIDLSAENTEEFTELLSEYIEKARKVIGTQKPARKSTAARGASQDLSAVRAWLREQGHQVSNRGRIPGELIAAYEAAH